MNRLFNDWSNKEVVRFTLPIGIALYNGKLFQQKTSGSSLILMVDGGSFLIRKPEDLIIKACNFNSNKIEVEVE